MIKRQYSYNILYCVRHSGGEFLNTSVDGIPVKLIAEGICGRWLALCRYAKYRHTSSSPGVWTEPKMRPSHSQPRPAELGRAGLGFSPE